MRRLPIRTRDVEDDPHGMLRVEDLEVTLVGAGRSGSMIALVLAMLGIRMRIYDPDRLGPENQGLQLYQQADVRSGARKVEALASFLRTIVPDARITTYAQAFAADPRLPRSPIVVIAVDTMATRTRLWECFRNAPGLLLWIDVRLGRALVRVHEVFPALTDDVTAYEASLHQDDVAAADDCFDQAVTHAAATGAAMVGGAVRAFADGVARPQWSAAQLDRGWWHSGPKRSVDSCGT